MIPAVITSSIFRTLAQKLGSFAFIPLGLMDNSVVPLPGSMDALLIYLAASHRERWWYYAIMAAIGSVIGGYVTYHIARKGGEEALEKRLKPKQAKRAKEAFGKHGAWSVVIGGMAPPPVPIVPFLATAGAMQYPPHKFVLSLAAGRLIRFGLVGWLASRYGGQIFQFLSRYYRPALWIVTVLGIIGGIVAIILYRRNRKDAPEETPKAPESKAA